MNLLQNIVGAESEELLALTQKRHGALHQLRVTRFHDRARRAVWGKVLAVQNWLAEGSEGETALLLDADTVMHRAIAPHELPSTADLGMVMGGHGDARWLNSGVMFIRRNENVRRFFEAVWQIGPQALMPGCPEGGDQGAINRTAVGSDLLIALMPARYNSYTFARAEQPIISGFHGLPHAKKREWMADILESLINNQQN